MSDLETFHSLMVERYGFALQIFLFLAPEDIYKCRVLNKEIKAAAEDELTWKVLYYQLCSSSGGPHQVDSTLLHQINRPINEAAIGWRVECNSRPGLVLDFRINSSKLVYKEEYLILFDVELGDGTSDTNGDNTDENTATWVAENDINNIIPSNSHIHFLTPPSGLKEQQKDKDNRCECSGGEENLKMRAFFLAHNPPPPSWMEAHKTLLLTLPHRHLATVSIHSDEILDVRFSYSGRLLAAVSRDGTFSLTQLQQPERHSHTRPHPIRTTTYHGPFTTHACNVEFSPSDAYVSVVSCNPYDPGGGAVLEIISIPEEGTDIVDGQKKSDAYDDVKVIDLSVRNDMSYAYKDGMYVAGKNKDSTFQPPPPKLRLVYALRMPFNISAPWLDETRIIYFNNIVFPDGHVPDGRRSRQTFCCVDIQDDTQVCVNLQVNGNAALLAPLRLAPGRQVEMDQDMDVNRDESAAIPGGGITDRCGNIYSGTGIVYATNASGFSIGYPQILCLLPLSAFGPRHERTQSLIVPPPVVDYDTYPHVDLRGAIVGIATNSGEAHHEVILVNVRPHIDASKDVSQNVLADISHDVEIRAFSALTLQHIYTFTGHRGFTLKDCPFYIFLDISSRYESRGKNKYQEEEEERWVAGVGEGEKENGSIVEECCGLTKDRVRESISEGRVGALEGGVLVASGSEDHKVYLWLGQHADPVQILEGHTEHVGAVAFNHKVPGMLATASDDTTVRIYCGSAY